MFNIQKAQVDYVNDNSEASQSAQETNLDTCTRTPFIETWWPEDQLEESGFRRVEEFKGCTALVRLRE
jgi:hypothetical protein